MERGPLQEVRKDWGGLVRDRRLALNLTQVQLAAATGIDQGTISRIEQGKAPFTDEQKLALAMALQTSIAALFPYPAVDHADPATAVA